MEESCFCQTDKYAYPTLCDRLCCCLCYKEKEELIKLNCCGKFVHRSCFINSSIIRSNNIINSKDTPETTTFSKIQICHYCQKPYDKKQFPNIPHTNEEITLHNKVSRLDTSTCSIMTFTVILAFSIALADNILLAGNLNKGMGLYKKIFINNCITNYTGKYTEQSEIDEDCSDSFYDETVWKIWMVCLTSLLGFLVFSCVYGIRCDWISTDFKILSDKFKIGNMKPHQTIKQYKEEMSEYKPLFKRIHINSIISSFELIWQLAYLIIIIGYNLWYIPSHTSSDTTIDEIRKLVLNYLPILCLFNVFWIYFIFGLLLAVFGLGFVCVFSFKCCCEAWIDTRKDYRNKIIIGETNIKLYSIDIDESIKKSNIV
jgi:hypothetical protein